MANASRDENHVPTLTAVLESDGETIVKIASTVNPVISHRLKIQDSVGGTDYGPVSAKHDENHVSTLIATSAVDGVTPVVIYATAAGRLLVRSS